MRQDIGRIDWSGQVLDEIRAAGLSPKSVWNAHICLRAALNDAIEDGLLERNAARGAIKPPKGREAQQFERRSRGDGYQDRGLVFCRPDGSPHNPDSISKGEFQRLMRRATAKRIRFHDQRHAHATHFLEAGNDVTVLSKRLGHASVKTIADLYVHVTERLQETAIDRFSAFLTAPSQESASNWRF